MARYVLKNAFDEYFEFKLIGLSSHVQDYRLCWAINKQLGFDFERDEREIVLQLKDNNKVTGFSLFYFVCPETEAIFELIANRNPDGYLIPELKQADYFLKYDDFYPQSAAGLIAELRKVPLVNMAFEVDVENLKSKFNLVY